MGLVMVAWEKSRNESIKAREVELMMGEERRGCT